MVFKDRADAGRQLAALLRKFRGREGVVYALPRGGVPIGAEVARELGLPLDIVSARKIGHPESPEYAVGAVTEGGELAVNAHEVEHLDRRWFERAVATQREEARRRRGAYYGKRTRPDVAGKLAIVVDDGIATGLTMEAALLELRRNRPGHLVMAVPVAPGDTAARLSRLVDEFIAVDVPVDFLGAVGAYYADFEQVSDAEVIALLDEVNRPGDPGKGRPGAKPARERQVRIPLDGQLHAGELVVPEAARGIVLFAHGSGSSRLSPRNTFVARSLHARRLATLLFDLLTEAEDQDYERRFDIELLTRRLTAAIDWAGQQAALRALAVGCFGASTGAAAALQAAALRPQQVSAVVSRGGRPDLADALLPRVRAPTLLIVGGDDPEVIVLNRRAYARLDCVKALEIVPGATHLFEEPGTLERVAELAGDWFERHLAAQAA